jgi:hypothetical protein
MNTLVCEFTYDGETLRLVKLADGTARIERLAGHDLLGAPLWQNFDAAEHGGPHGDYGNDDCSQLCRVLSLLPDIAMAVACAKARPASVRPMSNTSTNSRILAHFKQSPDAELTARDLRAAGFTEDSEHLMHSLGVLFKRGELTRVDRGRYRLNHDRKDKP